MEQISKTRELRARMAELFDLPADLVAGLAHLELLGDRQLLLEGTAASWPTATRALTYPSAA